MAHYRQNTSLDASVFPWPSPQKLREDLKSGDLRISTVISKFSAQVRDNLKVIEDHMMETSSVEKELRSQCEKMETLIRDLGEKCQALQQALLYKEEKYDEKCRESERYKVICELQSKSAMNDEVYFDKEYDENNNHQDSEDREADKVAETSGREPDYRSSYLASQGNSRSGGSDQGNFALRHKKIPTRPTNQYEEFNKRFRAEEASYVAAVKAKYGITDVAKESSSTSGGPYFRPEASHYIGGPVKRVKFTLETAKEDLEFHDRMAKNLDGINVDRPTTNTGPARVNTVSQPEPTPSTSSNTNTTTTTASTSTTLPTAAANGSNITLVGQQNQVVSSNANSMKQMRQMLIEKELHKQVAMGPVMRLASRRKKNWPF